MHYSNFAHPILSNIIFKFENFKFRKCYFLIATQGELLLLLSLGCTPICLNSDETCHDFTKPVFPNMTWAQVHYFWSGDSELRLDFWMSPTELTEYVKLLFGEKITPWIQQKKNLLNTIGRNQHNEEVLIRHELSWERLNRQWCFTCISHE